MGQPCLQMDVRVLYLYTHKHEHMNDCMNIMYDAQK